MPKALKKKYARKSRKSNPVYAVVSRVPRPLAYRTTPVPKEMRVTLRYCTTVSIDAGAAVPVSHIFAANDCYDPDITGTGHQPLGFDQWMSFYVRGVVRSSKIYTQWTNGPDVQSADFIVYSRPITATLAQGLDTIRESNSCHSVARERYQVARTYSSYKYKQEHKGLPEQEAEQYFTSGAAPINKMFYEIGASNAVQGDDITPIIATVMITYEVLFFDPKVLSTS